MTQTCFRFVTIGHHHRPRTDRHTPGSSRRQARAKSIPTPLSPPVTSEVALQRVFRVRSIDLLLELDKLLIRNLGQLLEEARRELGKPPVPTVDARRLDASAYWLIGQLTAKRMDAQPRVGVVTAFISRLQVQYGAELDLGAVGREIGGVEADLKDVSADRWRSNIKQTATDSPNVNDSLGPFLISREPGVPRTMSNAFISRNVRMIRFEGTPRVPTIPQSHFKKLERTVRNAAHRGIRVEEVVKAIDGLEGVSSRRAEVIARDQVGKHNSAMNRTRNQGLGVRRYRWRNVGDGAVRDEHVALEGQIFAYDNPPPGGHPGEPVQCRCWSEPVLEDLLGLPTDELDTET